MNKYVWWNCPKFNKFAAKWNKIVLKSNKIAPKWNKIVKMALRIEAFFLGPGEYFAPS